MEIPESGYGYDRMNKKIGQQRNPMKMAQSSIAIKDMWSYLDMWL